ncbi:MAG: MarR family transcriptional regulator [Acidobacteriota bacterium]|nr:MAG: MarR family transcriptional regulator [Acidobacteriota bacterium]
METSISRLLARIAIAHRNASEAALTSVGLHAGQANVLFSLWEKDGRSQAELTRMLGVAPPTVNVLVGKLEKQGLVESRPCPGDKRLRRIHLTEKGLAMREEAETAIAKLDEATLKGLSPIERNTVMLVLDRIRKNLCEPCKEDPAENEL